MNVLFLSLGRYSSIKDSNIYTDLLREFIRHGHKVYILSPIEKREGNDSRLIKEDNSTILWVRTGNITKTSFIEKGISTVMIESQFLKAIKKHFSNVKFDLVLYPTPPITFVKVVDYVKRRDGAKTYLLLKDIFPQNAVDIGILATHGLKGFIYRYFRKKEKRLYGLSDTIGCMSPANLEYVLKHNPEIKKDKVEVCPNVIEVVDKSVTLDQRVAIRKKYGIPTDKKVFVYGGSLGRPQGIDFLIKCIGSQKDNEDAFFFVAGSGTDYAKLEEYGKRSRQANFLLMNRLPKEDYDTIIAACDVGLIFLDYRFTIPNFPSRLLGYLQAKLPVLACTDPNTDIGKIIIDGGFGWWCKSNSVESFCQTIEKAQSADTQKMGQTAYEYLQEHYTAERGYNIIKNRLEIE